jgi:hypothetical protein
VTERDDTVEDLERARGSERARGVKDPEKSGRRDDESSDEAGESGDAKGASLW